MLFIFYAFRQKCTGADVVPPQLEDCSNRPLVTSPATVGDLCFVIYCTVPLQCFYVIVSL